MFELHRVKDVSDHCSDIRNWISSLKKAQLFHWRIQISHLQIGRIDLLNDEQVYPLIDWLTGNYRMESVSCQLQDMYKESISQSNSNKKSISSLDTRLTKLEEHTHRIVGLLEKLHAAMPQGTRSLTDTNTHARAGRSVSLSDVEIKGNGETSPCPADVKSDDRWQDKYYHLNFFTYQPKSEYWRFRTKKRFCPVLFSDSLLLY